MSKLTLLINSTYECLRFVAERKMIKLIVNQKVEVLSDWSNDIIRWGRGSMKRPAVIRLKYRVPMIRKRRRYNRSGVLKRDLYTCQYCGKGFHPKDLTIDHVVPKRMGGETTWENCVASCLKCNNVKDGRTPKMAGMKLLKKPKLPVSTIKNEYMHFSDSDKHESWKDYII